MEMVDGIWVWQSLALLYLWNLSMAANELHDSDEKKVCSLCISGHQETMEHILLCPALVEDTLYVNQLIKSRFNFWKIPFSNLPFISNEYSLRTKWNHVARERFCPTELSSTNLNKLTYSFWKVNSHKQFISTRNFMESLEKMMENRNDSPFSHNLPREDLLAVLTKDLTLQTRTPYISHLILRAGPP